MCPDQRQFQSLRKPNLINNFKRHLEKEHPNVTDEQTNVYIEKNLQKPELLVKFSIDCPKSECKHITHSVQKSHLRRNLCIHISSQHSENNYPKEFLTIYLKNNYAFVSVKKQLKNTKRKRTDITEQQSTRQNPPAISLQSLDKTESPIPSDDENSTVSDREFDNQETLILEQPSSKQLQERKGD